MPETFHFSDEVETWHGTVQATYRGTIPESLKNEKCARCGDHAVETTQLRMEWSDYLRETTDFYLAGGLALIPLCPQCGIRFEALEDGEKEIGIYNGDVHDVIETERENLLDDIETDSIIVETIEP